MFKHDFGAQYDEHVHAGPQWDHDHHRDGRARYHDHEHSACAHHSHNHAGVASYHVHEDVRLDPAVPSGGCPLDHRNCPVGCGD